MSENIEIELPETFLKGEDHIGGRLVWRPSLSSLWEFSEQ